jgi:WD40 repeat protein/tRNA A-37 threonylcarbamoyl transferase component Bud32
MTDDNFSPPLSSADSFSRDPSSLKGLTMALGIEPAKPGHDPLLGCDIGGVTIVRLIAEGGMGRVYEGKQEKPGRTVAVKVMRPGLTSPSVLKRFEYEAEVLGRLQHPGIAHIYSVGVHRMGNASVPYFIMEYIADARTLTKYANDLKLPARQRLDLFRSVCDAVAHGHQKGVIHRDLKPSNILVDGSGQPKVIDFGVARATDSDMALTTMQTDVGQLIGTLQYMSPEQFRADPNDIDVRSDVYALGVILYELLAGKMPYDVKKKAIYEVARIVQEDDPTPLSSFNRGLKGDVAVIASKCLAKDRGRRYSSASELGADIGRYLIGEAIAASPPGFVDGLVRLAKKHRAAAGAVGAIIMTLVAAIIAVSYFAVKARQERSIAIRERQRAEVNEEAAISQARLAEQQTLVATQAEERAIAEARSAKERLYIANLYRVAGLISENAIAYARSLLDETGKLRESRDDQIEISCLRSRLDDSLLVLGEKSSGGPLVAFSPSGSLVVTVAEQNTARVWDASSGRPVAVLKGHGGRISAIAFGIDEERCATASADKTARVWDVRTGRQLVSLATHQAGVAAVAFSPDGTRVATASLDKTARLWDLATGAEVASLRGHGDGVIDVAFMPDGARVVTASLDKTARIWNAESGQQLALLSGHFRELRRLAISRDGKRVVGIAGGNDESTRIWNPDNGKLIVVIGKSHPQGTYDVCFTADGQCVVTAGGDNLAKVWRVSDGSRVATLVGHTGPILAIAISRDGSTLVTASADATARAWSTGTWENTHVLRGHEAAVVRVALSADSTRLATGSWDHTARIWSTNPINEPSVLKGHHGWVFATAFSPDGTRLATGSWDRSVRLWDAGTGAEIVVFQGHKGPVNSVSFSPDGGFLASASDDGTVRIWDTVAGSGRVVISGKTKINGIAFSPNGKYLATASADKLCRLWDVSGWGEARILRGHDQSLSHVAFSPDGALIATASQDSTARIWDAVSGVEKLVLKGHAAGLTHVACSPNGRTVATSSADRTVRVWDIKTGSQVAVFDHRTQYPLELAFSPDGSRIVTGAMDNNVHIWDVASGSELAVLMGHKRPVCAIAMSPDGLQLATGSGDVTARLWGTSNSQLYRSRQEDELTLRRIEDTVAIVMKDGSDAASKRLHDAKEKLTANEYRIAANAIIKAFLNGKEPNK